MFVIGKSARKGTHKQLRTRTEANHLCGQNGDHKIMHCG